MHDLVERMEAVLAGMQSGLDDWPLSSQIYEYENAIKEIKSLRAYRAACEAQVAAAYIDAKMLAHMHEDCRLNRVLHQVQLRCTKVVENEEVPLYLHPLHDVASLHRQVSELQEENLRLTAEYEAVRKQLHADLCATSDQLDACREEIDRLRFVCAEAYQLAGALDAPVEALDNLSAAAGGEPLPHQTFLPVAPAEKPYGWVVEAGHDTKVLFPGCNRPQGFDTWPNTRVLPLWTRAGDEQSSKLIDLLDRVSDAMHETGLRNEIIAVLSDMKKDA